VSVAIEALQAAGVTGITVDFTLPDLIDHLATGAMPLTDEEIEAVRAKLDAKDAGALTALGANAAAYLSLIEAAGPFHAAMDKLETMNAGEALANRTSALRAIAKPIGWDITLTLDPTERHGFEYQSWFGFSIFAEGFVGEIGRGGSYTILHADGREEPAIGFSLFPDPLIDAGFGGASERRLFLPLGANSDAAKALRADGWHTVAALSAQDNGAALGCTHWLDGATTTAY
jgi:ATP phosphoribosyltransferase regulatory subunit